ncbi:uncharacterized protein N7525_008158 [Penicillium rubens]|uniref:uncharacterized protein n=1 Tax=Penicillium rubens TaxID=1108849 RepID=UPI002A5A685A|nr:uncharacterized protein N7525_008158 [Penicillium rubens]KAJ5829905.1 hypothetical protein N7525_008158 [Penicillium rubens]
MDHYEDDAGVGDEHEKDQEQDQDHEHADEKAINEEYKTWKKNAPFLYDMILSTALEWPTLTTQWLPDKQEVPDKPYSTHRLLIGTHTTGDAQNYLQIAQVQLPNPNVPNPEDYDEERGEIGGYDGRVMIWDRSKHPSLPTGTVNPQMELLGHEAEGFGLSWNPHVAGHLATGSEDKTVRLWDITTYTKGNKAVRPSRTFTHHSSIVNDVQHHPLHSSLIGTVSDDITLQILDTRQDDSTRAAASSEGQHRDAINSISFNPASETILATGSADKTIGIWDLRNLKSKLHSLEGHTDSVQSISWHPFEESVLASSSYDRKIMFWDLSRAGEEQTPEDAQDGPPELLFMHGGHTNRISDFSWNLSDPWVLCSAAEDNLLQVWKVADSIVGKDLEDVPTEEIEA